MVVGAIPNALPTRGGRAQGRDEIVNCQAYGICILADLLQVARGISGVKEGRELVLIDVDRAGDGGKNKRDLPLCQRPRKTGDGGKVLLCRGEIGRASCRERVCLSV